MGHLTVLDVSFTNFLWDFAKDLVGQLLEVKHLVNELKSSLDVIFESGMYLFFEVNLLLFHIRIRPL